MLPAESKRIKQNTDEEYRDALASDDPTKIEKTSQEDLAKEAIRKFKSL
ncbi:MAG: hypothetical protein KGI33_01705 [Thaumarchaeota archaeon]|nr:hypothetical protein [Nitrososphaerota archaeon]